MKKIIYLILSLSVLVGSITVTMASGTGTQGFPALFAKITDLTAHTGNASNPHSVTAAQAGAPTTATFNAHANSTSNPHSVTKSQVGLSAVTNNAQWHAGNDGLGSGLDAGYIGGSKILIGSIAYDVPSIPAQSYHAKVLTVAGALDGAGCVAGQTESSAILITTCSVTQNDTVVIGWKNYTASAHDLVGTHNYKVWVFNP